MDDIDFKKGNEILSADDLQLVRGNEDLKMVRGITRRDFVKYSAGTVACLYMGTLITGCGSGGNTASAQAAQWPIAKDVYTTAQQQILPVPISASAPQINPRDLALYSEFGYTAWQAGPGLTHTVWETLMRPTTTKRPMPLTFSRSLP